MDLMHPMVRLGFLYFTTFSWYICRISYIYFNFTIININYRQIVYFAKMLHVDSEVDSILLGMQWAELGKIRLGHGFEKKDNWQVKSIKSEDWRVQTTDCRLIDDVVEKKHRLVVEVESPASSSKKIRRVDVKTAASSSIKI